MYSYVTLKTDALNGVAITLEKKMHQQGILRSEYINRHHNKIYLNALALKAPK